MQMFSAQHYNALAKEIREIYPDHVAYEESQHDEMLVARGVLTALALNLCKRFKEDNPRFDPLSFLDRCSPNTDLYPLSELYEEDRTHSG